MSQLVRITDVEVVGAPVFLGYEGVVGEDGGRAPVWSSNGLVVLRWMRDSWRCRWNQSHTRRMKYAPAPVDADPADVVETSFGRAVLVPVTSDSHVDDWSDSQARGECPWLRSLPAMVMQSAVENENRAWWAAVGRNRTLVAAGRPRQPMPGFKDKKRSDSFVCFSNKGRNAVLTRFNRRHGVVTIKGQNRAMDKAPGATCARWELRIHVRLSGKIRDYTSVIVNVKRMTLSFVNAPEPVKREPTGAVIGLDGGVAHTETGSDGSFHDLPVETLEEIDRAIRRFNRDLARKRRANPTNYRASKRYQAKLRELDEAYEKARNIIVDWQQKLSTFLVRNYDVIGMEDLPIRNMTKRPKARFDESTGKWERNGRAAKAGLAHSLLRAALGRLRSMIDYKAKATGTSTLVPVAPQYTSQRCNECGYTDPGNRESQAVFECRSCHYTCNADVNAARNIEELALAQLEAGVPLRYTRNGDIEKVPPKKKHDDQPGNPGNGENRPGVDDAGRGAGARRGKGDTRPALPAMKREPDGTGCVTAGPATHR
ncbi:RNA-guided endonuclease InsQ/TnpB family protein [Bifidobacterium tissieri]|uniref:RNA-guided endonuclease InsQ/TnpB family protein n=1 Tax=Bifidobacterium tissieri TaxID=1630162 RepID=UPI00168AE0BF|nr:RNA-guided endonuclease TnpB family protein [Bifidobacterium tissieri]